MVVYVGIGVDGARVGLTVDQTSSTSSEPLSIDVPSRAVPSQSLGAEEAPETAKSVNVSPMESTKLCRFDSRHVMTTSNVKVILSVDKERRSGSTSGPGRWL